MPCRNFYPLNSKRHGTKYTNNIIIIKEEKTTIKKRNPNYEMGPKEIQPGKNPN